MLEGCRGIRFLGKATYADARKSQTQGWARGDDTERDRQRQTTGPQDKDVGQRLRPLQAKQYQRGSAERRLRPEVPQGR